MRALFVVVLAVAGCASAPDGEATPVDASSDSAAVESAAPVDSTTFDTAPDSGSGSDTTIADTAADTATVDTAADTNVVDTYVVDTYVETAVDTGPPDGCAPNAPVVSSVGCGSGGYTPKIYNAPWVCKPEMHIVSNYESYAGTTATVTFNSARSGVVLVLFSYKKLAWIVNVGPMASVSKILVKSFQYGSTATAPAGIPIEIDTGASFPECGFSGSPSDPCVASLEKKYGTKLTSMHYCYNAASFTLN
jgi:hypothetical protein